MKSTRKLILVLLTALLCLGLLTVTAFAAEEVASGTCGNDLTWVLDDEGTLTISGTGAMENYSSGSQVPWYANRDSITKIVFEDGVTSIGGYAFYYYSGLTSVTIPDNVTSIGSYAFYGCTGLTCVAIPESVTCISAYAFHGCTYLREVRIENIESWLNTDIRLNANPMRHGAALYVNDVLLTDLVIPDGFSAVPAYAFEGCTSLTSVTIPDGVTSIQTATFYNCSSLANITLPDSITSIGNHAFFGCRALTEIILPDSVTKIGEMAFYECRALNGIEIPGGITSIGSRAFYGCTDLDTITFYGDIPTIDSSAFYSVTATLYYPESNSTWVSSAGSNYGGTLTWVALGELDHLDTSTDLVIATTGQDPRTTDIHIYAEYSNGISLEIPHSKLTWSECDMSTAGRKDITVTFRDKSAQFQIAVHDMESSLLVDPTEHPYPESAHNYGYNVDETQVFCIPSADRIWLTFNDKTEFDTYSDDCFYIYDGDDQEIAVYTGSEAAGLTVAVLGNTVKLRLVADDYSTDYGYAFSQIVIDQFIHPSDTAVEGFDATCTTAGLTDGVFCDICKKVANQYIIPATGHEYESVVTPATPEANGYTTHTCIYCGDSYTDSETIYGYVDGGSCGDNVTWMFLEDGTLRISGTGEMGNYGGYYYLPWRTYLDRITKVIIEEGVTTIGNYAFEYCSNLTSVTIPDSVTSIGVYAFAYCASLTSVAIPDSVTAIGGHAFAYCESLTSVNIPERVTTIETYTFRGCDALIEFTVPEGVTEIGIGAFADCYNLSVVSLPDSAVTLGSYLFENCHCLEEVRLPAGLTELPVGTFADCMHLKKAILPETLTKISQYAFRGCDTLFGITIPASVTVVDKYAFQDCCMNALVFEGDAPTLYYNTFANNITTIYYPANNDTWDYWVNSYGFSGEVVWIALDELVSLEASQEDVNLGFVQDRRFDNSRILVYANYANGEKRPLNPGEFTVDVQDTSTVGTQEVTITHKNKTLKVEIGVHKGTEAIVIDPLDYPYPSELNEKDPFAISYTQAIYVPFADSIKLEFGDACWLEDEKYSSAELRLYDEQNNLYRRYYGSQLQDLVITVPGDTVKILLIGNGFYELDTVTANVYVHEQTYPVAGTPATCTETGLADGYYCEVCRTNIQEVIPALGHDYLSVITPAKPGVQGYTTHTCTRCGDSYVDNYTAALPLLDAPEVTKLENTASGIKITWGAVEGAGQYRLFVKTSSGWATVGTTTGTTLTYTGAKSGYTYTFTVRALNSAGTAFVSSYNTTGWKQTYVAQPAISKLENTASGIKITWGAVNGAGKYRVFVKTSSGWSAVGTTTGTSLTYTGAKSGYTYTFTVRALNSAGTAYVSSYNGTGWRQTYVAQPGITKFENTASGIKITWNAVAGAGKYRVFAKTSKGWVNIGTTTGTSLTYTAAKSGYTYTFTVRALNSAGTAFVSSFNSTGWKQTYVAQPAISKLENTASGVKITWGAVNGAAKYRVFVKTSSGWKAIGTTTGTSLTYTGAKSGYTYTFTVRALNSAGTAFVSSFNTTGWKQTYIAQPAITKLTNTTSGIKLTWGAVNGAAKYRVFVKTSKGWTAIGTTTGTSLTWTGAKSGYTYTFTVRCLNSAGTAYTSAFNSTGWSIKRT